MITRQEIESLDFTWFRRSNEFEPTNPIGDRDDYVAAIQRGEILVIIILRVYDNGYIRITNYFGNPMKNRLQYFLGEVQSKAQLEEVLDVLDFKPLKVEVNIIS